MKSEIFAIQCGVELEDIGTKNVREYEFNPILGYDMVRLDNWQNSCQIVVTVYRRFWKTLCSELLDWIELMTRLNEFEIFILVYNDEENTEKCYKNSVNKTIYK